MFSDEMFRPRTVAWPARLALRLTTWWAWVRERVDVEAVAHAGQAFLASRILLAVVTYIYLTGTLEPQGLPVSAHSWWNAWYQWDTH